MNEQLTQTPPEVAATEQAETETLEYLTPDQAANFAFHAIGLTQKMRAEKLFFQAIHAQRSSWKINPDSIAVAQQILLQRTNNYLRHSIVEFEDLNSELPRQIHHARITQDAVDEEIYGTKKRLGVIDVLANKLNGDSEMTLDEVARYLEWDLTYQDKDYLKSQEGRLRKGINGPLADRRSSVVVRHAILGQTTGIHEYDEVFRSMARQWTGDKMPDAELIDLYNQHHPEAQIDVIAWLDQRNGNGTPHSDPLDLTKPE